MSTDISPSPQPSPSAGSQLVRKFLVPLAIVALGILAAVAIGKARPRPDDRVVVPEPRIVTTLVVQPEQAQAIVEALGTTEAVREVTVIPEVSGRVVSVSEKLKPGRRVKKGEVLLRIDPRSYQYSVAQQEGNVALARRDVEVEKANRELALREDQLVPLGEPRSSVALREDHLAAAEALVRAQQNMLEAAKLQVMRTVIKAPFDGTIISENVDVGQMVGATTQVAHLMASDELRVEVSVALENLDLFTIPRADSTTEGSPATIRQQLGRGKTIQRQGQIVGLIESLDSQTRRARVLVQVDNALGEEGEVPLLSGAAVEVSIQGKVLDDVTPVPRHSISEGRYVWTVDEQSTLHRVEVEVLWATDEQSYLAEALPDGARVVTSKLELPLEGEKVRVQ